MKLVAFGLVLLGCLQSLAAPDRQVIALHEIRMMLTDSRGVLKDWNDNQVSPCYLANVRCDQHGDVIGMLLDGNSITGGIPQELGNLSNLMTLKLGRNKLNGSIPESVGLLSELQNLDLSQNLLIGNIPSSLSNLSSLNNINLAYNSLSGEIPEQLLQVSQYNYTGNHFNCDQHLTSCAGGTNKTATGGSRNSRLKVIIGSIGGAVTLIVFVVLFLLWWQRMRHHPEIYIDVAGQHDHSLEFGQIKRFSWRELQIATNNFSELSVLGKGGFGKVYIGVLPGPDGKKVAVKRLFEVGSPEGEMAFLREVELISIAVHKNILRLIGFCTTPTERLLVYPFMENLSVASRLRDIELNEQTLDWPTRMRIALGAARGLEYLHEHCNPKIIHRDVKAANVLLDGKFEAVIGDFGLAKMMDMGRNTVTTGVRGTMGHIAPEYFKTGRPSVKTDIFGYGVMLLEIVTGERAIFPDFMEGAGEVMLIDQVKLMMQEGRLEEIIDRNINCGYDSQELVKIIQVALLCTHINPGQRPAMSEVVHMLEGNIVLKDRWEEWQQAELTRRKQYENNQHRKLFSFSEESLNIHEAIELSGGR
ncbi:LRR receptor kinase SERK2-like isoform X1 [Lolium rigidum]|uniref:LRR receptor kinase SERK2-like isoform X1 n=1 Tax=Lolium rigidum TaxID=89674 RepID=UPI001F5C20AF|nr:LRR receptor kinase SERK2-like isoform X1 [Lolium rigidum]XP_047091126.1 LRR receptor kinase SERK2-like isoform X1 [Lolium rigidum]XP_047091127.1 LRR receptor kinase SERK2-like isoform X1 [Lolium rigidum]XP_047091128.1 LRR receptor kinase SERK2-like isoform X1 [Lolium rigidum]XP_047091129.1 LRR receptor kinase SERK2-like isoform X1 [Lolium rigidum]